MLDRILEPEIMDDPAQADAYARTDFTQENQFFVDRFREEFPDLTVGHVLDLGCGPADIPIRFVLALPLCRVTGVDASLPMIQLGEKAIAEAGVGDKITLVCERIQSFTLSQPADALMSNSLVHHLPNPMDFWTGIRALATPGAPLLVMDLIRPESMEAAHAIVDRYAANASAILRRDFYHSLLASFTREEVFAQLAEARLGHCQLTQPDDRHWVVSGWMA